MLKLPPCGRGDGFLTQLLRHAGAVDAGRAHLCEHLVQPLQGPVEVQLNPAGGAGHGLTSEGHGGVWLFISNTSEENNMVNNLQLRMTVHDIPQVFPERNLVFNPHAARGPVGIPLSVKYVHLPHHAPLHLAPLLKVLLLTHSCRSDTLSSHEPPFFFLPSSAVVARHKQQWQQISWSWGTRSFHPSELQMGIK